MTVFESALFILSAAKAIQYLINAEFRTQTPNLAYILVRDSMIYFGSVLALILINLIIWKAGRVSASRPLTHTRNSELTIFHFVIFLCLAIIIRSLSFVSV